jgi:hypothetical protein
MNYDDWKLSNPIDDGDGYDMLSNCCGAKMWDDCDICPKCKDHCEPLEECEYDTQKRESIAEDREDEKRDLGL